MKGLNFTAVIIDDDKECISTLRDILKNNPEILIVGEAFSANEGYKLILETHPDILFLDVEMPGVSGIDMLNDLQVRINWKMQVIFCTAYDQYLLAALRAQAFDFLLKPFSNEEFDLVMKRFFQQTHDSRIIAEWGNLKRNIQNENHSFMTYTCNGLRKFNVEQVVFFEYSKLKKTWWVTLTDGTTCQLKRGTTAEDVENFSFDFVQINKFQIINCTLLHEVANEHCILTAPFDKYRLVISRAFHKAFQSRFDLI